MHTQKHNRSNLNNFVLWICDTISQLEFRTILHSDFSTIVVRVIRLADRGGGSEGSVGSTDPTTF